MATSCDACETECIETTHDGFCVTTIKFCLVHEAAPEMLVMLEVVLKGYFEGIVYSDLAQLVGRARGWTTSAGHFGNRSGSQRLWEV